MDDSLKIIKFLNNSNPKTTLEIAKHVHGDYATCNSINPLLYEMQRQSLVYKITNNDNSKPRWTLMIYKN